MEKKDILEHVSKKIQTQKTSVVYTTQSTLWTYSFHVLKHMVDNFHGQLESLDLWDL